MATIIRFRARVTKDMAWGEETFDAIVTGELLEGDDRLVICQIEPEEHEEDRLQNRYENMPRAEMKWPAK